LIAVAQDNQLSMSTLANASSQDLLTALRGRWPLIAAAPVAGAVLAIGVSFLITPMFTARTVFVPPQQQQSSGAAALASLGALSGLAGLSGVKSTADQYVSLLQSLNVENRLIDQFKLVEVYEVNKRVEAQRKLEARVRIALGKKDGLITVEVDDDQPQRAAEMANQYVAELKRLSTELSLTETQQRRTFFEGELKRTQASLATAQEKLQSSGFNAGAIKAEPKAAAEGYARLKADTTAAQVRLRTLRAQLAEATPEVQAQLAQLQALSAELQKIEGAARGSGDSDYLGLYRDFKYQETLFDLLSKQFELARLDEAREGALIQVVDVATPPEIKSSPKRSYFAAGGAALATLAALLLALLRPGRPVTATPAAERQR
jgi:uncharacterized protein involved in exopolysaccharide biosynthesis